VSSWPANVIVAGGNPVRVFLRGLPMLRIPCLLLCAGLVFGLTANAEDKKEAKEVKLAGTVCCAKCELKKADKCHTVIVVKKNDKETIYWFDATGSDKYHKEICTETKEGTVTGTVKKDGDKMIVTVSKVEFK
jgi:hypothetical protein